MARNKDLTFVGADGRAYAAQIGSTAPSGDPTNTTLDAAFKDMGWCHQDGLEAAVDEDRQEFPAWGSLGPIDTQVTKRTRTFVVAPLEANPTVLGLYDGVADPTPDATGLMDYAITDSPDQDLRAWVFDSFRGGRWIRYYVAQGEITGRENLTHKADEMAAYKFTVTAYPGSDGVSVHKWIKMPALASG